MTISEILLRKLIREVTLVELNNECLSKALGYNMSVEPRKSACVFETNFYLDIDEEILIDDPPSEFERVKELNLIKKQYNNKFNDESMLCRLDVEIDELFDELIIDSDFDSHINLIKKIKSEISESIYYHKEHFSCLRPKFLAKKHNIIFNSDDLESAESSAYPSGHAAQGYYIAYRLSDRFPLLRKEFLNLAKKISQSRLDRGVHFPSDIKSGKVLAKKLYKKFKH
jgi:hypothetical protein